jgi:FtsH-binding integral membrane protein
MAESSIILALALTLMVIGALWLYAYLTNRAVHQVIGAFCQNNALHSGRQSREMSWV